MCSHLCVDNFGEGPPPVSAWLYPCALRQVTKEMGFPVCYGRTLLACTELWLQHYPTALGWDWRLCARPNLQHQWPTSLKLLWQNTVQYPLELNPNWTNLHLTVFCPIPTIRTKPRVACPRCSKAQRQNVWRSGWWMHGHWSSSPSLLTLTLNLTLTLTSR